MKLKIEILAVLLAFAGTILFVQLGKAQQPALVEAAEVGNMELVEHLVTNNADINANGVWGANSASFCC